MRSFKSNENIHKKEGGSYYVVSSSLINVSKNVFSLFAIQADANLYVFNKVMGLQFFKYFLSLSPFGMQVIIP